MNVKTERTYKCPHCGGTMHLKAGGKKYYSYYCDICPAMLQVEIQEELEKVNIGGVIVTVSNKEAADILKREWENK